MGLLTENEVILIKNLYAIIGFYLASRFLIYGIFHAPDIRNKDAGYAYLFAFVGTIICGYSAIVTAGYGSWDSLGTPNFYSDWALTVPLILLSMWAYETIKDEEISQQLGIQISIAAVAIAVLCIFLATEPEDTANNELWVVFGAAFFLAFTTPIPWSSRQDSVGGRFVVFTGSNRWLATLLAVYPLLYYLSIGGVGDGVADNRNSLLGGFTKDSFDNSFLESIGFNWYDLIALLFLLSFVCKFFFSYWHVRSLDPDFDVNITAPVDNPNNPLQAGLLTGATFFVVLASIAAFLSYLTL